MKKSFVTLTVLGAVALALSGCSGGGATATDGDSDIVKLMVMGPIDSPLLSLPTIPGGAQAAVDLINDGGGINGRDLELITCNDQADPNIAINCVRTAIEEGVVAMVGGFTLADAQVVPLLDGANIPTVGMNSPNAFTTENSFQIGGEGEVSSVGVASVLVAHGCERVAAVSDSTAPQPATGQAIAAGVEGAGGEYVDSFAIPENSSDWAPTVAATLATGADCIASSVGPTSAGAFLTALRSADPDITVGQISGGLPESVLSQLGPISDGILAVTAYYPTTFEEGDIPELLEQLKTSDPDTPYYDNFTMSGYASVQIVAAAIESIGSEDVTAESVLAALPSIEGLDTGVGPIVDLSTPTDISGFERQFNTSLYAPITADGRLVLEDPTPVDTADSLRELVASRAE